ncbi:MAG: hypothetical protein V8Q42_03845 [Anaerovoracaceae bacterium]
MGSAMALDKATIRNLELTEGLFDKKIKGSLLGVLDRTSTAMGSRKLRQWIKDPLNDVTGINMRLDAVDVLCSDVIMRNNMKEYLKRVYDFERLTGRIACRQRQRQGSDSAQELMCSSAGHKGRTFISRFRSFWLKPTAAWIPCREYTR